MYVSVIVNVPASQVDKTFEYRVPNELESIIKVGSRVGIPFGNSDRLIYGFITDIHEKPEFGGEIKDLEDIPDLTPVLNEEQLQLALEIKKTTFSPLVRIYNSMIPQFLKMSTFKYISIVDKDNLDSDIFTLFSGEPSLKITKKHEKYLSKIKKEIDKGYLELSYKIIDNKHVKKIKYYLFDQDKYLTSKPLFKKGLINDLISNLNPQFEYEKMDLLTLGLSDYNVNILVKKGILKVNYKEISRIKERNYQIDSDYYRNYFNSEVLKISDQILNSNKNIVFEVDTDENLMQTISYVASCLINEDKTTLVVVPDILSSYKLSFLIKNYLGIPVLTINTDIENGESYDAYCAIKNDEYKVIVTTPVGILWPYQKLGAIFVVDSESATYYNDQSPRYYALDIAKIRSKYFKAKLIETKNFAGTKSYYQGINNEINYLKINSDLNIKKCIVDMRREINNKNYSPLSIKLRESIQQNIENNEATLIILNNKGYSDFVLCRSCGHVEICEKCHLPFKYREKDDKLVCPSCGIARSFSHKCSSCNDNKIKFLGLGSEKLAEIITGEIKGAKVKIVEEAKYLTFKKIVDDIEKGEVNVVIATSTYARGFVNTTFKTIAILVIDLLLKKPSFEAFSETYGFLKQTSQIINRSHGEMIIQSYNPDHFVITSFLNNDDQGFVTNDLKIRKQLSYPPFFKYNRIIIKGHYQEIFKESYKLLKLIKDRSPLAVIYGPSYNYSYGGSQLLIRHNDENIDKIYEEIYEQYKTSGLIIIIDKYVRIIT